MVSKVAAPEDRQCRIIFGEAMGMNGYFRSGIDSMLRSNRTEFRDHNNLKLVIVGAVVEAISKALISNRNILMFNQLP